MRKRLKLVAMVVVAALIVTSCGKDKLSANTMRMLKHEGIVKLFDANNKELTLSDNLRLNSGSSVLTEVKSLAGLALDDTKMLTIDELSKILINKDGKKLTVDLEEGSLFFEVTEKLDADASFDIRTSTMVVGIRGTSGIVTTNDKGEDVIIVTDGSTEVTAVDLGTGKTVSTQCDAGHSVTAHVQSTDQGEEVTFDDAQVKPTDLKPFAVDIIANSDRLMEVVPAATGWSQDEIRDAAGDSGTNDSGSTGNMTDTAVATAATAPSQTEEVATDSATGASSEALLASNTGAAGTSTPDPRDAATTTRTANTGARSTNTGATANANAASSTNVTSAASAASSTGTTKADQDAAWEKFQQDLARAQAEEQEQQQQESVSSTGSGSGGGSTSGTSGTSGSGTDSGQDTNNDTDSGIDRNASGTDTNATNGTDTNNTSGTDANNTSGTDTNNSSGTDTNNTSGTDTNNTSGTDTNNTSGTDTNGTDTNGTNNVVPTYDPETWSPSENTTDDYPNLQEYTDNSTEPPTTYYYDPGSKEYLNGDYMPIDPATGDPLDDGSDPNNNDPSGGTDP